MLGAVNHQRSHRVPKSQLSPECRLFRRGQQNPEDTRTNKTTPQCCCNGRASVAGHKPTTEVAACTRWMFGHANTTHLCAERATNAHPSSPTLAHATGLQRLCRVWVTGRDLDGKSSTRKSLLLLSGEGCTYCVLPLRKLASLAKAPGFMAVVLCGDSSAAVLGKMDCPSLVSGCSPLLLADLA